MPTVYEEGDTAAELRKWLSQVLKPLWEYGNHMQNPSQRTSAYFVQRMEEENWPSEVLLDAIMAALIRQVQQNVWGQQKAQIVKLKVLHQLLNLKILQVLKQCNRMHLVQYLMQQLQLSIVVNGNRHEKGLVDLCLLKGMKLYELQCNELFSTQLYPVIEFICSTGCSYDLRGRPWTMLAYQFGKGEGMKIQLNLGLLWSKQLKHQLRVSKNQAGTQKNYVMI
uniref:Uncharacterized protein n=1 Tax=Plectus sambesii TaxID=2011161 RepID=A0A914WBU2_9BILA